MVTFHFRKCLLAILLMSPLASLQTQAQQLPIRLQQLTDSAQLHFPSLLRRNALAEAATSAITESKHAFLPQFRIADEVTTGTDNAVAGPYFPMGIVPSVSGGIRASSNNTAIAGNTGILYGQYTLADFGYRKAYLERSVADLELSKATIGRDKYDLSYEVSRWYFNLVKFQYKLAADAENNRRYEAIFSVIRALSASGIKAGADSSLALAELSRSRITYQQSLAALENCRLQLAYLTGIDSSRIQADTSFLTASRALQTARDTVHPLLSYYQALTNNSMADQRLAATAFRPKVFLLGAGWARGSDIAYNDVYKSFGNGLGYQRFNYAAAIALQYDLFGGIHKRDRLHVLESLTKAAQFDEQTQEISLQNSARQAQAQLAALRNNIAEIPIQLAAATDTYRQKLAQYRAGIINIVDLTNAAFVLYRSKTDYAETMGDWYLGQLQLAYANGSLYDFIKNIQ